MADELCCDEVSRVASFRDLQCRDFGTSGVLAKS